MEERLPNWLKVLVAVTCVAVLSAIGFWSWKTLDDQVRATERATLMTAQGDCNRLLQDLEDGRGDHVMAEPAWCISQGHFTVEDLRRLGRDDVAARVEDYFAKYGPID